MLKNLKNNFSNKEYKVNFLLQLIFIFMPIFVIFFIKIYEGFTIQNIIPVFNDEIFWYQQVMSVIEYGNPLGYYGYNNSHAALGTFGPWGPSIVYFLSIIPMLLAIFFKINGYFSLVIGNIFWICFANFLFLKFTKPNRKNIIRLIFISLILFINWLYLLLSMAEILRYSFSVILAGMIIYCLNTSSKDKAYPVILYIVAPITIACFTSAYIMFSAIIPIWFYCIYKRNKHIFSRYLLIYFFASFLLWGFITIGLFMLNNLFSAPYVTNGYENIIYAFKESIISGIRCVLDVFSNNVKSLVIWTISGSANGDFGLFSFYIILYYLVIGFLIFGLYNSIKTKNLKNIENNTISLYMLLIFLLAFLILYTTNTWTFIRGINVAFTFALYVMSITDENAIDFKNIFLYSIVLIVPFIISWNSIFMPNRVSEDSVILLNKYKNIFSNYINIEPNKDPWNNTIAIYGNSNNILISAFPAGAGINHMMNGDFNINSKYIVLFYLNEHLIAEFEKRNYEKIYSDNYLAIFNKMQ